MINIKISGISDLDSTMERIIKASRPIVVHKIASQVARKQVLSKYLARFEHQVSPSSMWQSLKQLVAHDLPGDGAPGFLTGTTFSSVVSESDGSSGRVYPKGRWPNRSDKAVIGSDTSAEAQKALTGKYDEANVSSGEHWVGFKWCAGKDIGLEVVYGGYDRDYVPSGNMRDMVYGADTSRGHIDWLYLDSQDESAIARAVDDLLDAAILRDLDGMRGAFREAEYDPSKHRVEGELATEGLQKPTGGTQSAESMIKGVTGFGKSTGVGETELEEAARWLKEHEGEY